MPALFNGKNKHFLYTKVTPSYFHVTELFTHLLLYKKTTDKTNSNYQDIYSVTIKPPVYR